MPTSYAGSQRVSNEELTFFAFDDYSIPFHQNLSLHMEQARKYPDNPVLRRTPGSPDSHGAGQATILQQNGQFCCWYTAFEPDMRLGFKALKPPYPIHIAYAQSEDGHLLTCPIGLDGEYARVYLNVDSVGNGAWVQVEALDEKDQPLPGYTAKESVSITENGLRQQAVWRGQDKLSIRDGRAVTLKVTLHSSDRRQPRIYAVYVTGTSDPE